ncbi:MAG: type VI secretion system tip protein TssI/VgrG [Polyangiales bacterium]
MATDAGSPRGVIELVVDDLGQRFAVARLRGVEGLSTPYHFDLDVVTARRFPMEGDTLVGHAATARFTDAEGTTRRVRGVIVAQRVVGHAVAGDRLRYRVRLAPRLAVLRRRRNSRIFQDRTALEIVGLVLHRARVAMRADVAAALPRLEYCVQYRETDLGFVERLLAEHGIAYWFEHPDDPPALDDPGDLGATVEGMAGFTVEGLRAAALGEGLPRRAISEVMVLTDRPEKLPRVTAPAERPELDAAGGRLLRFARAFDATSDVASDLTDFEARVAARVTSVQQAGFDPMHPTARPEARAQTFDPTRRDAATLAERLGLEVFLHRDEYARANVDRRGARLELERRQRRALEAEAAGRSATIAAGARFTLEGHPVESLNRSWTVVSARHEAAAPELADAAGGDAIPVYRNAFRCVPSDRPWRPKSPPRRVQQVMETATVVGPPGEAVHTDDLGRVRVRFHWDRGDASRDDASCWIRVAQPWAGDGHGAMFLPRVGSEVLVAFLDGDTDRPVVLGGLYNGAHGPPWPTPDERSRQGFRGRSVGGPAGDERHNEFSFEDRAGAERLHLRAARTMEVSAAEDRHTSVGRDDRVTVAGARHVEVQGALTESVAADAVREVAGDLREVVRGARRERTAGEVTREVEGDAHDRLLGAREVKVTRDDQLTVRGDRTERVAGNLVVQAGESGEPRSLVLYAHDRAELGASRVVEIRADEALVLRCGTSLVRLTPTRVEVLGQEVIVAGEDTRVTLREGVARARATKEVQLAAERVLARSTQGGAVGVGSDVEVLGAQVRVDGPDAGTALTRDPTPPPTRIALRDADGAPIPFARFEITLDDGSRLAGVLDAEGRAALELDQGGQVRFVDHPDARMG